MRPAVRENYPKSEYDCVICVYYTRDNVCRDDDFAKSFARPTERIWIAGVLSARRARVDVNYITCWRYTVHRSVIITFCTLRIVYNRLLKRCRFPSDRWN